MAKVTGKLLNRSVVGWDRHVKKIIGAPEFISHSFQLSLFSIKLGCRCLTLLFCLLAAMPSLAYSTEKVFYRYLNDDGVKVINFSVPPQYVKNGYDVVNLQGQVIRSVERQKTKEELAREAETQRIKNLERNLMRRYSSTQELLEAKQRRLSEVTAQIRMIEGNVTLLTSQLNKERFKAALKERKGAVIPESIQTNIDNIEDKREDARRRIARLKQNYKDVETMFEKDIATFKKIEAKRNEKVAKYSSGMSFSESKSSM